MGASLYSDAPIPFRFANMVPLSVLDFLSAYRLNPELLPANFQPVYIAVDGYGSDTVARIRLGSGVDCPRDAAGTAGCQFTLDDSAAID